MDIIHHHLQIGHAQSGAYESKAAKKETKKEELHQAV